MLSRAANGNGEASDAALVERETHARHDGTPRIKQQVAFHPHEMTLSVMLSDSGNILTPLTDGGLRHFISAARANVGSKSGRYVYELTILETMGPPQEPQSGKPGQASERVLIGFSTANSSLFLEDHPQGVCFDMEGAFVQQHGKRTFLQKAKFGLGCVVAVVLNLEASGANANTMSLFVDGQRVSAPMPLPSEVLGKALYPTINFRGVTLACNFGPTLLVPLAFECRSLQTASVQDVNVLHPPWRKDGKSEVLFPVGIPDEGTFDWLDQFLMSHPNFTELSDRALIRWAKRSGLVRSQPTTPRSCRDKPEALFTTASIDLRTVSQLLQVAASTQDRDFVVMEVLSNLISEERAALTHRWPSWMFRRTAAVVIGPPPLAFKQFWQEALARERRAAGGEADLGHNLPTPPPAQDGARTRELQRKRKHEEMKLKYLINRKQREASGRRAEFDPDADPEVRKTKEALAAMDAEMDGGGAQHENRTGLSILSQEEIQQDFRPVTVPDLTSETLERGYAKFSIPSTAEGFDGIRYEWAKLPACKDFLHQWQNRMRNSTKVESIRPGAWFQRRWREWQTALESWQERSKECIDDPSVVDPTEFVDIYTIHQIDDTGGGMPMFYKFEAQDWALLSLRVELTLLLHAVIQDIGDEGRRGFPTGHLHFYYSRYFRKPLNLKAVGAGSAEELLAMVRDTIMVSRKLHVLVPLVPSKLETFNIYVKLTEDARRQRVRKRDLAAGPYTLPADLRDTVLGASVDESSTPAEQPQSHSLAAPEDVKAGEEKTVGVGSPKLPATSQRRLPKPPGVPPPMDVHSEPKSSGAPAGFRKRAFAAADGAVSAHAQSFSSSSMVPKIQRLEPTSLRSTAHVESNVPSSIVNSPPKAPPVHNPGFVHSGRSSMTHSSVSARQPLGSGRPLRQQGFDPTSTPKAAPVAKAFRNFRNSIPPAGAKPSTTQGMQNLKLRTRLGPAGRPPLPTGAIPSKPWGGGMARH